jgi:predicted RNase H-like HicB family nuclease
MNNTMEIVIAGISEPDVHWTKYPANTCFECRVGLLPETDGSFSVYAINLPGVASQGENEQEAIANITDALVGALMEYKSDGEIPWADELLEKGVVEKRILIDLSNLPVAA